MNSINKPGVKRTLSSHGVSGSKQTRKIEDVVSEAKAIKKLSTQETHNYKKCSALPLITYRLDKAFFDQPCIKLAKSLLGKVLVRKLQTGDILRGKIVETECYLGIDDRASHSYMGKRTARNEAMFSKPGTAYVYPIYGMYFCFNISSQEEGSAVLIRALEPLENASIMQALRIVKRKNKSVLKDEELCSGPSKLCLALQIDKNFDRIDLSTSKELWVENGENIVDCNIVACKRIGIDSAGEVWANKPLRFYVRDCIWVSERNRAAENLEKIDS